jgi:hypothetical protein
MASDDPMNDYVTTEEAALLLDTTPTRILMLLRQQALAGRQEGSGWLVSRESIACCKAHGRDMKAEMGCRTYCSSGGCGCGK